MNGAALQQRLLELLIGRIREETYPSASMMDLVEESLRTREQVEAYAEILLEKIESDRFPSIPMINRFERLITRLDTDGQGHPRREAADAREADTVESTSERPRLLPAPV